MNATPMIRLLCGTVLVAVPDRIGRSLGLSSAPAGTVIRILGLRDLGQGLLTFPRPTRPVLALAGVIDSIHLVSMLTISAASPRWRRAALTSALVSSGLTGVDLWRTRTAGPKVRPIGDLRIDDLVRRRDLVAENLTRRLRTRIGTALQ